VAAVRVDTIAALQSNHPYERRRFRRPVPRPGIFWPGRDRRNGGIEILDRPLPFVFAGVAREPHRPQPRRVGLHGDDELFAGTSGRAHEGGTLHLTGHRNRQGSCAPHGRAIATLVSSVPTVGTSSRIGEGRIVTDVDHAVAVGSEHDRSLHDAPTTICRA